MLNGLSGLKPMEEAEIMALREYTPELLTLAAVTFAGYAALYVTKPKLKNFSPKEFGIWWPFMDDELLKKLDQFRTALGEPVIISPITGSIGRLKAAISDSQHIIGPDLTIRSVDVMVPKSRFGVKYSRGGDELKKAFDLALQTGFRGVGVYKDWQPYAGMHLDTRKNPTHRFGSYLVDTWSGVFNTKTNQNDYFAVGNAFA